MRGRATEHQHLYGALVCYIAAYNVKAFAIALFRSCLDQCSEVARIKYLSLCVCVLRIGGVSVK